MKKNNNTIIVLRSVAIVVVVLLFVVLFALFANININGTEYFSPTDYSLLGYLAIGLFTTLIVLLILLHLTSGKIKLL